MTLLSVQGNTGTASIRNLILLWLMLFSSLRLGIAAETTAHPALPSTDNPEGSTEKGGLVSDEPDPVVVTVLSSYNSNSNTTTQESQFRQLQSVQQRTVLVVRVNGASDTQALSSAVFTDFTRQMSLCSHGLVKMIRSSAGGGGGVISVQVGSVLSEYNMNEFVRMAETAALQKVNGAAQGWSNIRQAAHHIIIILPLISGYKYVGDGQLNFEAGVPPTSGLSTTIGAVYGTSLSVLMHEIGKCHCSILIMLN